MLMPAFETLVIASPIMRFVGTSVMPGLREIARRTASANDIDIDPYLLREAASLAKQEGLAERMSFQEVSRSPPSRSRIPTATANANCPSRHPPR
jgi:hypothetical protein